MTSAGKIINALLVAVIGLALLPVLLTFIADAQGHANITATDSALIGLVSIIYVIGLFVGIYYLMIGKMGTK